MIPERKLWEVWQEDDEFKSAPWRIRFPRGVMLVGTQAEAERLAKQFKSRTRTSEVLLHNWSQEEK
jgi:hypothetical protein